MCDRLAVFAICKGVRLAVEPQRCVLRLARAGVRAVAMVAVLGEDGLNVLVERKRFRQMADRERRGGRGGCGICRSSGIRRGECRGLLLLAGSGHEAGGKTAGKAEKGCGERMHYQTRFDRGAISPDDKDLTPREL